MKFLFRLLPDPDHLVSGSDSEWPSKYALRVIPAETRLTVYRRLRVVRSTLLDFDLVWPLMKNQAFNGNMGNLAPFSKNDDLNEQWSKNNFICQVEQWKSFEILHSDWNLNFIWFGNNLEWIKIVGHSSYDDFFEKNRVSTFRQDHFYDVPGCQRHQKTQF